MKKYFMKGKNKNETIKWLLEADVSIRYQTYRDLMGIEKSGLRQKISKEGWGAKYLSLRNDKGNWGKGFYQPKWTSTHYTLLDLKNLNISPDIKEIKESISLIIRNYKCEDGGINPSGNIKSSDVCINGMFLNYASYFHTNENDLKSIISFLLSEKMPDGGFNCHSNRKGAVHSSLHTTLSVLEGIFEYIKNGYKYRVKELSSAEFDAREFILLHKLFKSHRTDQIIKNQFLHLSYPPRWYYDILRALDYFYSAEVRYDDRILDALNIILKKRGNDGRWKLQAHHPGQVHFAMETVGEPSRWNTLRAMRVLRYFGLLID